MYCSPFAVPLYSTFKNNYLCTTFNASGKVNNTVIVINIETYLYSKSIPSYAQSVLLIRGT